MTPFYRAGRRSSLWEGGRDRGVLQEGLLRLLGSRKGVERVQTRVFLGSVDRAEGFGVVPGDSGDTGLGTKDPSTALVFKDGTGFGWGRLSELNSVYRRGNRPPQMSLAQEHIWDLNPAMADVGGRRGGEGESVGRC